MVENRNPFVSLSFLRSIWSSEYELYKDSEEELRLMQRLEQWRDRLGLKETAAQQTFIELFFHDTWGYYGDGQRQAALGFTLHPNFPIPGAGQKGNTGLADVAMGWFNREGIPPVPQVLCEFKDIRSNLDAQQKRKGNTRSPVQQCKDYLWNARRGMFGNEAIIPTWAIVTDMNEFRLYWWDRMPQQYMQFIVSRADLLSGRTLLDPGEDARFERYVFSRVFSAGSLLTLGGKSPLERVLSRQWIRERQLENDFYSEYREIRERIYNDLLLSNVTFTGSRGRLVQLTQKILDRLIFVLYCEDMGQELAFPPQLLRDYLRLESLSPYFDANGYDIWERLKRLFAIMDTGGVFPPDQKIARFNGGLFAPDAELASLRLSNMVFCEKMQGQNEASIGSEKRNVFYLSATYNFADRPGTQKTLGLYTLGRIFEQSITELEMLEARVEGRDSINTLGRRKTDGVYYTPESVVDKIVEETIAPRLIELRTEVGWKENTQPTVEQIASYWERLTRLKVVDPACGSGAFLISAFRFLRDEFRRAQAIRKGLDPKARLTEEAEIIEDVLRQNIYGVDISPSSVEITKLALWLHTAQPNQPLSALDRHIRDGNSLVDSTFDINEDLDQLTRTRQELINKFDWWQAFPEVKEQGGFDIVVGNPPYVKLQNFKRVYPEMERYLRYGRLGSSYFESTQTGNFDLYLPFIEKGLWLLNEKGRMGLIAPSLWLVNEYGEGLRRLISKTHSLERWVDFKSHQIFDEAITYTALQFFTKRENQAIKLFPAPDGEISAIYWDDPRLEIPYDKLSPKDAWHLLPSDERIFIDRLKATCARLDDPDITSAIFQGLITSADHIYHLRRIGLDRYLALPGVKGKEYEVEIEDGLMRPLVSGQEAKRYQKPETDTFLLFPYAKRNGIFELLPPLEFASRFPKGWRYLEAHVTELRKRENNSFDDDRWYRFGRNQNLDKQEVPKLIVAQTVPRLRICLDDVGAMYLNNVRVNGILPAKTDNLWFLLGILNSRVCDFIFRRIAAPKGGGYFEANRQYIAPLPVPRCTEQASAAIADNARQLQSSTSRRRDVLRSIRRRTAGIKVRKKSEDWIFPDTGTHDYWIDAADKRMSSDERSTWAKEQRQVELDRHYSDIKSRLLPEVAMEASSTKGELKFLIDGRVVIDHVFVAESELAAIEAQWAIVANTFEVTERTTAKRLVDALRSLIPASDTAVVQQLSSLLSELRAVDAQIANLELTTNRMIYKAYELTGQEIQLVEGG